jgi:hypothetical protein
LKFPPISNPDLLPEDRSWPPLLPQYHEDLLVGLVFIKPLH